ncbi:MAG: HD domain-containing protein [Cellulomonas sp.]
MVLPLPALPVAATGPIDTSPIVLLGARPTDLDPIWTAVVSELRVRGNDIHVPISMAYTDRLCAANPEADSLVVRIALLLHDTGWARVDETKIISEGFSKDWRKAQIRFEHEKASCAIAREVLPPLGYGERLVEEVCAIIDGHDTRQEAHSLEDAMMRDADRLWRFTTAGVALISGWFGITPATNMDRLRAEIIPELLTAAGIAMGSTELTRTEAILKSAVVR